MEAIEPLVRQFCTRVHDPLMGSRHFDFIEDLGAWVPMRTIGYHLGIPEEDQAAIRNNTDELLALRDGKPADVSADAFEKSYRDTGRLRRVAS